VTGTVITTAAAIAVTATKASAGRKRNMATPSQWVSAVCTRNILTLVYYGLRYGHIRAVAHPQVAA
jgi:hypothetical protein